MSACAPQLRRSCVINSNNAMPQSFSAVYIHLVFSTKERRPFFRDQNLRSELHNQLGSIFKETWLRTNYHGRCRRPRASTCPVRSHDYASRMGEGTKASVEPM